MAARSRDSSTGNNFCASSREKVRVGIRSKDIVIHRLRSRACRRELPMVTSGLAADVDHGSGGGDKVWFADVVPGFFAVHHAADEVAEFCVRGTAPHEFAQVVIPDRK